MIKFLSSYIYFIVGIIFLSLAWAKHKMKGYSTPTKFDSLNSFLSVEHSLKQYEMYKRYLGNNFAQGRNILELCPGGSLGLGAILLRNGALSYTAVDAFNLANKENLSAAARAVCESEALFQSLIIKVTNPNRFIYIVDRHFQITEMVGSRKFDIILSNAAFEHFDNPLDTIRHLTCVAAQGCVMGHNIDIQTHSRWIRDRDPNNIYRYSSLLYWFFSFPGQPNRFRPSSYIRTLKQYGWNNVQCEPQNIMSSDKPIVANLKTDTHRNWLSFFLIATR